jgi:hypothetical protein
MPSPIKKKYYKYLAIPVVILLLMFIFPMKQSFFSINPSHLPTQQIQTNCTRVYYNHTEEGWLGTQESATYTITARSGINLWCEFEHSFSFSPPENESDYIIWGGGCDGEATITITNNGETIFYCVDEGETSTYGSGVRLSGDQGDWTIEILNLFNCDVYYRYTITIYGCSNMGVGGSGGPKMPP